MAAFDDAIATLSALHSVWQDAKTHFDATAAALDAAQQAQVAATAALNVARANFQSAVQQTLQSVEVE